MASMAENTYDKNCSLGNQKIDLVNSSNANIHREEIH